MSVLERIDCSAVGSLHLIQVRFLCSFYYETSRLSRSLLYTSVPGSVGFKGRALCLLLKDHCCFSYIWTTSGVFNPLVITWQTWQIQTESTVQITLFGGSHFVLCFKYGPQCPDDLSWLCCFFHACHFHIPWKVVKSYQVAHAFQFMEDWSHLLPGTMGVPSTFFNCRRGLTRSFMSSTKF